jgi:hypothetical protein
MDLVGGRQQTFALRGSRKARDPSLHLKSGSAQDDTVCEMFKRITSNATD